MSAQMPRRGGRVAWALRHYAWVILACILALAAVPLVVGPGTPMYQADALVVARQLTIQPRVLPSLAETVFADGAVAAAVADDPALRGFDGDIIPDRIAVVAAQDSVTLVVQARDEDPEAAARLADKAAAAYATELNRPGAGVGEFAVHGPAVTPSVPVTELGPQVWAGIGAAAGLLLGLGLVALLAVLRRPVVTATDVENAIGVPLLGTVRLPRVRPHSYPQALGVGGIANVTRWLASLPPGRLLFLSRPETTALRQRVYVMVTAALWTVRPVGFEADPELVDAVEAQCRALRASDRGPQRSAGPGEGLVLVDGGSPLDIVDPVRTRVSAVVVATRGVSRQRLRALTSDYQGAGLVGVILVEVGARLRGSGTQPAQATPSVRTAPTKAPETAVPEPERA